MTTDTKQPVGRPPTGRTAPAMIRLTPEGLATLDAQRGALSRGAFIDALLMGFRPRKKTK